MAVHFPFPSTNPTYSYYQSVHPEGTNERKHHQQSKNINFFSNTLINTKLLRIIPLIILMSISIFTVLIISFLLFLLTFCNKLITLLVLLMKFYNKLPSTQMKRFIYHKRKKKKNIKRPFLRQINISNFVIIYKKQQNSSLYNSKT